MTWSPTQYLQFEDDRTRPVRDLVAAIPTPSPQRAVDVGCGPGNSTEVLAARFPDADVSGIDSSPEMIEAARARLPGHSFAVADVTAWTPEAPCDVLLSNAVLQWVPGHPVLLPRLVSCLREGGTLAVQMPDNMDEPAHRLMRELADEARFKPHMGAAGGLRAEMASARGYYEMLRPHCRRVEIWTTTYQHILPGGADAVVEWFKGSGLRPYLSALEPGLRAEYLAAYRERIGQAYRPLPDGSALLPFPRLFIVATR